MLCKKTDEADAAAGTDTGGGGFQWRVYAMGLKMEGIVAGRRGICDVL